VALVFEGETRTFGELDRRVNQLANALAARGVEQGARVAILMHNGIPVIESYLACAKVGAWAVPLNFRLAPPEVAYIVQDSGSCGIVSDGSLAATAQPAAAGLRFHLSTGD
jgi:acyl-CoA synthetase (AMP-forming)/AMP-acid ligase II